MLSILARIIQKVKKVATFLTNACSDLYLTYILKYCMIIKQTRPKNKKVGRNARN